jgi:hypothetical protein
MSDSNMDVKRAFDFCLSPNTQGTFIPSHISMFMNRIENVVLWEFVYVHETLHSILTDSLNGWWIQLLEEIGTNMFVTLRSGKAVNRKLISWILNLEYKKRKLCESWLLTQEGIAAYFQLQVVDIEKRVLSVAPQLYKMRGQTFSETDATRVKKEVEMVRKDWVGKLSSREFQERYWKGYELVESIAKKFGKDNLVPVSLAASSVRFPRSLISQSIDDFQKTISQEGCTVDKRLELISKIPENAVKNFSLKDDWWDLTQEILQYLKEEPLEKEFNFKKMVEDAYTDPALPKEFVEIAKTEIRSQFKTSEKRWNILKTKGIESSQLVPFFNVEGEAIMMSNFEPAYGSEIDEVLAMQHGLIFNGLDKMVFINDLLKTLSQKDKVEKWMEELKGFGDLERFREMFPLGKLFSLERICCLCHDHLNYSNPGLLCSYSNLTVCMKCCSAINCQICERFSAKRNILMRIEENIDSFSYEL